MFGGSKVVAQGAGEVVKQGLAGVGKILDGLITNQEEKGKIDIAFNKLQTKINEIEAASKSLFVSGWRPFIGWVCGFGLGFNFVIRPIMNYVLLVFYTNVPLMESLDTGTLLTLITGMLGFGALRTYEKKKKISRN